MAANETVDSDEQQFKTDDADSYNAVVDYFDQYTERFTSHLLELLFAMANIPVDGKVLDAGTGTGIVALDVATRLATQGSVVGIDLSDGMLATATHKAKQKRLGNTPSS